MNKVGRARRHHRLLSILAFGLLALVVELLGRSLTHRVDLGRHLGAPANTSTDYYPFLLMAVKAGVALLLARLVWRLARAHSSERAGHRILAAVGARPEGTAPRVRVRLSPRLWLVFFLVTACMYLIQVDAEGASAGRWPLLAPWLHSSALPAFAVLAVFAALAWKAVAAWLTDYEQYALATIERAKRLVGKWATRVIPPVAVQRPPRRLFGLAFESRPPPFPA
jgi:hypothetical protein